jgi:hypothetical protein
LDTVAGMAWNDSVNPTKLDNVPIRALQEHVLEARLVLKGEQADVFVDLDRKKLVRFSGKQTDLTGSKAFPLADRRMLTLLGASACQVTSARLRMVSGKAVVGPGLLDRKPIAASQPAGAGEWIDLMKFVRAEQAVDQWEAAGGIFRTVGANSGGDHFLFLPVAPEGSYEIAAQFVRTEGTCRPFMHLPIGAGSVTLLADGLSQLDGSENNETRSLPALVFKQVHTLQARVRPAGELVEIVADLDGKPLVRWKGLASRLTPIAGLAPPKNHVLDLGFRYGLGEIRSARLRMLWGTVKYLEEPATRPATAPAADGWKLLGP